MTIPLLARREHRQQLDGIGRSAFGVLLDVCGARRRHYHPDHGTRSSCSRPARRRGPAVAETDPGTRKTSPLR